MVAGFHHISRQYLLIGFSEFSVLTVNEITSVRPGACAGLLSPDGQACSFFLGSLRSSLDFFLIFIYK